jgi:hypothetical protein
LLRFGTFVAAFLLLSMPPMLRAQEGLQPESPIDAAASYPESWSSEIEALPRDELSAELQEVPSSAPQQYSHHADAAAYEDNDWSSYWPKPKWFGLRHSSTHGRHVEHGEPLVGTSWRNRPFYVGGEIGPMWFTQPLDDNVSRDIDIGLRRN